MATKLLFLERKLRELTKEVRAGKGTIMEEEEEDEEYEEEKKEKGTKREVDKEERKNVEHDEEDSFATKFDAPTLIRKKYALR